MDENHIDAETEEKIKVIHPMTKASMLDTIADLQAMCDEDDKSHARDANCYIQRPTAPDSMFVAETPLVYQKEFFGFLLTVTKNSVGILIELHTSVKASAVFGLCCRFLTGLGVPAAQIGGVEPIFSEWLPFPTSEA